jgi:hypothetical protein
VPTMLPFQSQRTFVRDVLEKEVGYRAIGPDFTPDGSESEATLAYRQDMNAKGSPSQAVSAGYRWAPGTELNRKVVNY